MGSRWGSLSGRHPNQMGASCVAGLGPHDTCWHRHSGASSSRHLKQGDCSFPHWSVPSISVARDKLHRVTHRLLGVTRDSFRDRGRLWQYFSPDQSYYGWPAEQSSQCGVLLSIHGSCGAVFGTGETSPPLPFGTSHPLSARDHLQHQVFVVNPYMWSEANPQTLCSKMQRVLRSVVIWLVCDKRYGNEHKCAREWTRAAEVWEGVTPRGVCGWLHPYQPLSHSARYRGHGLQL